jgi:flagellar FliJ protein
MAFKFSLATVLRVRGIVEEREERMLQKIQQEISNTRQAIAQADGEMKQSCASRAAALFQVSSGTKVHASYGEVAQLRLQREQLEGTLGQLIELRTIQIEAYNAARRNREMLTEMRAERREMYGSEVSRREQSALDDHYIARRGRV